MALTEKSAREAIALINSMIEQIPEDIMFLAFCEGCLNVREFQYGRCLVCKAPWHELEKMTT